MKVKKVVGMNAPGALYLTPFPERTLANQRLQIHTEEHLIEHLVSGHALCDAIVQGVDLADVLDVLKTRAVSGAVFLGCDAPPACAADLVERGAAVFPSVDERPYDAYRAHLYTADELYAGFDPDHPETLLDTLDSRVYAHWKRTGRERPNLVESLMRRLHDLAMGDAIADLVTCETRAVAVMGGHALSRQDPGFRHVVEIGRGLAERRFLPVSGGGPGAMEATHLGACLVDKDDAFLDACLAELETAPLYDDAGWLSTAMRVRAKIGTITDRQVSLAVPTWLYGHEPATPFATHIAKYFANAVREDGLVTIARHGIIYTPGSAGTVQEVFQDTTQNHYETLGEYSPMVFLGRTFWTETLPVIPLLEKLGGTRRYLKSVGVVDTPEEALAFIESHPPVRSVDADKL
jgi:predicted Rossmann-fold nucleotide-binding protein